MNLKACYGGQQIKIYTDHKSLIQDALGFTSDHVYQWRQLLKEFGLKNCVHKGAHNTVADAILHLDFGPNPSIHSNWMTFTQCWCHYTTQEEESEEIDASTHQDQMNLVFANYSDEDAI